MQSELLTHRRGLPWRNPKVEIIILYILYMRKIYALVLALLAAPLSAQVDEKSEITVHNARSGAEEVIDLPEGMVMECDSLLSEWMAKKYLFPDTTCVEPDVNPLFTPEEYRERLHRLPVVMEMPYNDIVQKFIDRYRGRLRRSVSYMLGAGNFYVPLFEEALDYYGLPLELKYLPVIESALDPTAKSKVGAVGLWQFMLATAKRYDLKVNSLVDERCHPYKSTWAAARFLKDLYAIFGDWNLVIAAYNCGPGNVNKAIHRAGGVKDYWTIYPYLPAETRGYVPAFIAANYIMNYYCEHNLCPLQTSLPLATDTVMVNNALHLQQVSEILQLDIATLRALNPQYKRDIVPGNVRPSVLKLPAAATYAFTGKEDTVFKHRMEEYLANVSTSSTSGKSASVGKGENKERITHIVASGENLYTIANRYGVTAKEIRNWNGLRSNRVPKGKRLKLFVDNGGIAIASAKPKAAAPSAAATTAKASSTVASKASAGGQGNVNYTVKSGDSLFTIAKKYPGVSAQAIQQANGLASSSIHPGQVLKIPVG